jgi:hypothetical protein
LKLLCGCIVAGIARRNPVACILERDRNRVTDTARAAGNEGHSCHADPPWMMEKFFYEAGMKKPGPLHERTRLLLLYKA